MGGLHPHELSSSRVDKLSLGDIREQGLSLQIFSLSMGFILPTSATSGQGFSTSALTFPIGASDWGGEYLGVHICRGFSLSVLLLM